MKVITMTSIMAGLAVPLQAQTIETDSLLKTLRSELDYNMAELAKQTNKPYFMALRLTDTRNTVVQSDLGAATVITDHQRMVTPQIRLGDMAFDNFKFNNQGSGATGQNARNGQGVTIPLEGNVLPAMRQAIWREVMRRYKVAQDNLQQARSKVLTGQDNEDKAPCFSKAPVESYYEAPLNEDQMRLDVSGWKEKLNKVSSVFKQYADIETGKADLSFDVIRTYVVNSDGTRVVQNRKMCRVMISASVLAPDGMSCPLNEDFLAFSPEELPDVSVMIATAQDMVKRLKALRQAPIADPYTGPAILSGPASGVFFHEIFGHRLEGHRLKSGGQTFKKMVGKKLLPETFNVYCDPTLKFYHNNTLNGYYVYDEEGVKGRRVNNIEHGILTHFLMSRVPLDGFPESNGHGRAVGGNDPVSRQSNLIVETEKPYTDKQLRQMLIAEAKKQDKPFGYYFKTVTSGFTYTGEGGSLNSFNVTPIEVYRIYVDGRPDELVRGVDLIGTPLSMFSNITAAGDTPSTFTGVCGAESGWVPVSASSPTIFVSKIETQRRAKEEQQTHILPAPEVKDMKGADEQTVIFSAMEDEMKRTKQQLAYKGYPHPIFANYTIGRSCQLYVSATLGGLVSERAFPTTTVGSVNVSVGDSIHISDMQAGQATGIVCANDVDYNNIRRELWKASDDMYKYSLNASAYKQNYLMNNPVPEEEQNLKDMLFFPASEHIDKLSQDSIPADKLAAMARRISAIFNRYPKIYNSNVQVFCKNNTIYRLTSENVKRRTNNGFADIYITASIRSDEGTVLNDRFTRIVCSASELDEVQLDHEVTQFAERMMEQSHAKPVNDYYVGPVMYEDNAVAASIQSNLFNYFMASRSVKENSSISSMLQGKRIVDKKINVTQLAGIPSYKGTQLLGNYEYDANGIAVAKQFPIIQGGVLKTLLCGRYPALNATQTTGNDRFMADITQQAASLTMPGIVRMTLDGSKPLAKMKDLLRKEAKAQGLQTAYIVRQPAGMSPCLYRVNVKTGAEEMVLASNIPTPRKSDYMHIVASASEENVFNSLINSIGTTVIAPRAIIVESIENYFKKPKKDKDDSIRNPLDR